MLETSLGKKAKLDMLDMQPGDVGKTYADIGYSKEKLGYSPKTSLEIGIPQFVKWFKKYHQSI